MPEIYFEPLPGTAAEAKALSSILPNAVTLTKERATEWALKEVSGPSILHIATHGFFLTGKQQLRTGTRGLSLASSGTQVVPSARNENPLLRSGLALAGANWLLGGKGEDGILSALEAAGLDLSGTKLVVLSACETGLGDIKKGEGVYGLRRAMVLAGSESQVITLWLVEDNATRDLMVAYYKRLQAGEGRTEALRQVQLEMIKNGKEMQGKGLTRDLGGKLAALSADYSHPFFWASFIQSGDWRGVDVLQGGAK